MTEAISIATIFEDFGLDHAPDGWPPIKQMNLTAAAAELRRLEAQLQKETAARQAAQIEAEALKERLVRADAEKCAAVLAERIAPKAPMQEPVHRLIYPGGGKALFNRLWHLTCNAVATQSGMRVRTDVMPMREMKEFLDHLCVLVDSPPQPVPAPVQEPQPVAYLMKHGQWSTNIETDEGMWLLEQFPSEDVQIPVYLAAQPPQGEIMTEEHSIGYQ